MSPVPWRLVTVDIDGTLTTVHGWLTLARAFGREAEYHEVRARLLAGTIGEDENLVGLLRLAEGRTRSEVEGVLAATPKLAHIPEGVARLHAEGMRVALLTHNPPLVTDWYRRFAGFDDAAGIGGRQPVGQVVGRAEGIRADKVGGLEELCQRAHVTPSHVVHVGDAPPDAVIFARVGGGIALNARRPEVEEAADVRLRTTDFDLVVDAILTLGPRR